MILPFKLLELKDASLRRLRMGCVLKYSLGDLHKSGSYIFIVIVEPLLSGHSIGDGKWLFHRGSLKINIKRSRNVTLLG